MSLSCTLRTDLHCSDMNVSVPCSQNVSQINHLLPGIRDMALAVIKQLAKVLTAIAGMAAAVGSASVSLNTDTHSPSQNMCMR